MENVAEEFVKIKRVNNAKARVSNNPNGNSFDAVMCFPKANGPKG